MSPGQTFTKTWRLVNTGTCAWSTDYSIAVFSGEPMGASTGKQLPSSVAPGGSIDISVDLAAPTAAGTYQGNWKLRNAAGQWFGIGPNGNSPFWVKIIVEGTPGATTTTTTTTTATATHTSTPGTPYPGGGNPDVLVSGNNNMIPGDKINLDSNQINAGGADLGFEAAGQLVLAPAGGGLIGLFGGGTPSYNDCASKSLTSGPLALEDMSAGIYLCYRTDEGRYGYLRLLNFDMENNSTLGFQMLTWTHP
jgi:hypothetical protein